MLGMQRGSAIKRMLQIISRKLSHWGTSRHTDLENLLGKRKRNVAAESEGVKTGSGIVRFRTQQSARMGVWGLEKGLAPLQVS